MNLRNLKRLFTDNGCQKVYVKELSPNDNSKNQVYLGGSFEVLNILPVGEIINEPAGDWNKERFKAAIKFSWINEDGNVFAAPGAQLILYPKYPEVRFSGFLKRCQSPPSELMANRIPGRLLFLGISNSGMILGYVAAPDSEITKEFHNLNAKYEQGIFKVWELSQGLDTRKRLLDELYRIHLMDWIVSKRLDKNGNTLSCNSSNCGGYTLEAELGITPNGYSEPDFLGWEVKQFGVKNLNHIGASVPVTLMTPEPTHGHYVERGADFFIRFYGYQDLKGRADRINFGGIHKASQVNARTGLSLEIIGFDSNEGKIKNTDGKIALLDNNGNEAASWSFTSLLKHWNRKHNQACYIPSLADKNLPRKYKYGNKVILGTGTDFQFFLKEMSLGNIYYDPGIKMENASIRPIIKRRSQFRIKSGHIGNLYKISEIIQLL